MSEIKADGDGERMSVSCDGGNIEELSGVVLNPREKDEGGTRSVGGDLLENFGSCERRADGGIRGTDHDHGSFRIEIMVVDLRFHCILQLGRSEVCSRVLRESATYVITGKSFALDEDLVTFLGGTIEGRHE